MVFSGISSGILRNVITISNSICLIVILYSLLAMELCAGSLQDFCVGRFTAALSTDLDSVKQLLEGLAYLHQNNFVHTNINPSNILISSSGTMKISGLGNCELLQPSKTDSLSSSKIDYYCRNIYL